MAYHYMIRCWARLQRGSHGWDMPAKVSKFIEGRCAGLSVLHLFGGHAKFGVRLDCDPLTNPDVLGDAWMPPFERDSFDVVVLDPPYFYLNSHRKVALWMIAGDIARKEVWWFHTHVQSSQRPLRLRDTWPVLVAPGASMRVLQRFEVLPERIGRPKYFTRGPEMRYNARLAGCLELPFG